MGHTLAVLANQQEPPNMLPRHLALNLMYGMALWHILFVQRSQDPPMRYIRAERQTFAGDYSIQPAEHTAKGWGCSKKPIYPAQVVSTVNRLVV